MQKSTRHYWTIDQAYQHALEKFPRHWYERRTTVVLFGIVSGLMLATVQASGFGIDSSIGFSLIGVTCYVVGLLGDVYSTQRVMRLKSQFDRRGIDFLMVERHPLLPEHPTFSDHFRVQGMVLDVMLLVVVWFIPIVGIASLSYRLCAVFNNQRKHKRLLLLVAMMNRGKDR